MTMLEHADEYLKIAMDFVEAEHDDTCHDLGGPDIDAAFVDGMPPDLRKIWLGLASIRRQIEQARQVRGELSQDDQYLTTLPRAVPIGRILVHNHVKPSRRLGSRGFRAWLSQPDVKALEHCDCNWARGLGTHYRVRAAFDKEQNA